MSILRYFITSKAKRKLLRLFLEDTSATYYTREIARLLDEPLNAVRRELGHLEKAGLLRSSMQGNQKYYRVIDSFPLLHEWRRVILETPDAVAKPPAKKPSRAVAQKAAATPPSEQERAPEPVTTPSAAIADLPPHVIAGSEETRQSIPEPEPAPEPVTLEITSPVTADLPSHVIADSPPHVIARSEATKQSPALETEQEQAHGSLPEDLPPYVITSDARKSESDYVIARSAATKQSPDQETMEPITASSLAGLLALRFREIPGISMAIIHGEAALREDIPADGIDLLIVGDIDKDALLTILSNVEEDTGVSMNFRCLTRSDFDYRNAKGDPLIRKIWSEKKLVVKGRH